MDYRGVAGERGSQCRDGGLLLHLLNLGLLLYNPRYSLIVEECESYDAIVQSEMHKASSNPQLIPLFFSDPATNSDPSWLRRMKSYYLDIVLYCPTIISIIYQCFFDVL